MGHINTALRTLPHSRTLGSYLIVTTASVAGAGPSILFELGGSPLLCLERDRSWERDPESSRTWRWHTAVDLNRCSSLSKSTRIRDTGSELDRPEFGYWRDFCIGVDRGMITRLSRVSQWRADPPEKIKKMGLG